MKRTILLLLLSTLSLLANPPWPGVAYTEVRAFAFDPKITKGKELIGEDLSLKAGVLNKAGVLLDAEQVKRLLAAQAARIQRNLGIGCYLPHNLFVFYNAEKKPVAFLEICFDCLGSRIHPPEEECAPDLVALAKLCSELKLPFGKYKTFEAFQKRWGEEFSKKQAPAKS